MDGDNFGQGCFGLDSDRHSPRRHTTRRLRPVMRGAARASATNNRLTGAAPVSCRQPLAPAAGTLAADRRLGTMPSPWPRPAERATYSVVGLRRSELLKAPKLFRRGRRMIHRPRTRRQVFLANHARKLSRELVRRCSACRLAATSSPLCQQFGERRPIECRWRHQTNRVGDDIALDRVVKRVVPRERRRRIDLDQVRLEVFVDEAAQTTTLRMGLLVAGRGPAYMS